MVELDNVERWTKGNNLTLNRAKCTEIHDIRRKCQVVMPHLLPYVARVQSMKVLGVTSNCNLSVLDHVNNITRSSAQTIRALRILRAHGMVDSSLHVVYRAVVVTKLTYAASAWWGFAFAADRQRIAADSGPSTWQTVRLQRVVFWRCSDDSRISRLVLTTNCLRKYCATHITFCTTLCRMKQSRSMNL